MMSSDIDIDCSVHSKITTCWLLAFHVILHRTLTATNPLRLYVSCSSLWNIYGISLAHIKWNSQKLRFSKARKPTCFGYWAPSPRQGLLASGWAFTNMIREVRCHCFVHWMSRSFLYLKAIQLEVIFGVYFSSHRQVQKKFMWASAVQRLPSHVSRLILAKVFPLSLSRTRYFAILCFRTTYRNSAPGGVSWSRIECRVLCDALRVMNGNHSMAEVPVFGFTS